MFCPQCGTIQLDELKFCKSCGTNVDTVRQALHTRETLTSDHNKTQVAVLLSEDEQKKLKRETERVISPEEKRHNEIKSGLISMCVGIGVMIFVYVVMQGVILSGQNSPADEEILSRIWVAGVIPFLAGVGLVISGLFVKKSLIETSQPIRQPKETARELESISKSQYEDISVSSDSYEAGFPVASVTENTTRQLRTPIK